VDETDRRVVSPDKPGNMKHVTAVALEPSVPPRDHCSGNRKRLEFQDRLTIGSIVDSCVNERKPFDTA